MVTRLLSFDILKYLKEHEGYQDPIVISDYFNCTKIKVKEGLTFLFTKGKVGRRLFKKQDKNLFYYKYRAIKWT